MKYKIRKASALLLSAALIAAAAAGTAFAASRSKVGKINLTVGTNARIGNSESDAWASSSGSNSDLYYVDSAEVTNSPDSDNWNSSSAPEITVYLGVNDEEEYYFGSSSSSSFKLSLDSSLKSRFDKIRFVSAKRMEDNAWMEVKVRLIFDEDRYTSAPTEPLQLAWEGATATWEDLDGAKYFEVELLRDGSQTGNTVSTYDDHYDFTSQITAPGTYSFRVRAVGAKTNAKSSWSASPAWSVSQEMINSGLGSGSTPAPQTEGWQKAADNVRWWWRNADGSYPASQWKEVNGVWYYFDAAGYMATGWINLNGISYYLDPSSGAMYANRRTPDGYWVDAGGAWIPGM